MTNPIPSPAVQRFGNAVLLQGPALVDVAALVAAGLNAARYDGISAPPRLQRLLATLREASESGHADVRGPVTPAPSSREGVEVTTAEAAHLLGLTDRQVRRLAPSLGGRRTQAGWLIHRAAVEIFINERNAA